LEVAKTAPEKGSFYFLLMNVLIGVKEFILTGMKNYEFYTKYKISNRLTINRIFYKRSWWQIIIPTVSAILIGPLIIYKYQRSVLFSLNYYFRLLEYCFLIITPFILAFLWLSWRELVKQSSGYGWVGTFEVLGKQSSFIFCYLLLKPGKSKLKVERSFFEKARVGDLILIRRDALGSIEEIKKVHGFSRRLSKMISGSSGNK
jgi:hypothetical protein